MQGVHFESSTSKQAACISSSRSKQIESAASQQPATLPKQHSLKQLAGPLLIGAGVGLRVGERVGWGVGLGVGAGSDG